MQVVLTSGWKLNHGNRSCQSEQQTSFCRAWSDSALLVASLSLSLWPAEAVGTGQTFFSRGNSLTPLPAAKVGRQGCITQLTLGAAFQPVVRPEAFLCLCLGCIHQMFKHGWHLLFSNSFKYLFLWCVHNELLRLVPPISSFYKLGHGGSYANTEHGWFTRLRPFKPWHVCAFSSNTDGHVSCHLVHRVPAGACPQPASLSNVTLRNGLIA